MSGHLAQLILQHRKIVYMVTDADFIVIDVGGQLEMLNLSAAEILGARISSLVPELFGAEEALLAVFAGERPTLQFNWVNRERAGGGIAYFDMLTKPYQDDTGRITGLLHTIEDVTKMGQLQQALYQQRNETKLLELELACQNKALIAANAELQRLDELKSKFVSIAAHELRTPLTSISGYVEMLLDGDLGAIKPKQQQYLDVVHRAAHRLLTIINSLLNVTKIELGQVDLSLKPTDLSTLLHTAINELHPQITDRQQTVIVQTSHNQALRRLSWPKSVSTGSTDDSLTVCVTPDDHLPLVSCDPTRITEVMSNLLSNASKYTARGGEIGVTLTAERGHLQVAITDNGIGISEADQAKLFKSFFRADNGRKVASEGTGLGLYICQAVIKLHQGNIWCESQLGQGSTFYFTLPISST